MTRGASLASAPLVSPPGAPGALSAAALYFAATLLLTWPLAPAITSRIGGDTGDTLFNCWVLLWTSGQVLRALHGDAAALADYWNGNIFYPSRLTLAYSEHLTPQMLQVLPVFAATGNIVLAYNLLLLSTFVLSGLGMYLLVRDLTGRPLAAFLAGLAFAFAPYRIDQFAHIEVISSQWMPFAFLGLRRFILSGRLRPLAGGAAALLFQALSCGYYMAFFTPFAVAYCLVEMIANGKIRDARVWRGLTAAGVAVLLIVGAFMVPYFEVRRGGDIGVRPRAEIEFLSADVRAFANAPEQSTLWGARIRAYPHPEGQGFPGFAILFFAGAAMVVAARDAMQPGIVHTTGGQGPPEESIDRWRQVLAWVAGAVLATLLLLAMRLLVTGRDAYAAAGFVIRYRPATLVAEIAAAAAALLTLSPPLRGLVFRALRSRAAGYAAGAFVAAWLSLGPVVHANGEALGPGLYALLYRFVPGFNGLRVPSLYFMIVAFFLAILTGLGADGLLSRLRAGRVVVAAGMAAIVAECLGLGVVRDVPQPGAVYANIRELPAGTVVAELPFGDLDAEIRYTFFAGFHRKPIVNGYSGYYPEHYRLFTAAFTAPIENQSGWRTLLATGATHAVVHEGPGAYRRDDARSVSEWLVRYGAKDLGTFGGDRLFQLR